MFCFHSWIYQPTFRRKLHLLWSTNTHICDWLRERAHAPCTHTHTHHDILTIRSSAYTLICIDLPCMHATHQEHLPMTTLPHDHSCMSREAEPRSSVKWLRSTTDSKALFQMLVNSLLSSIYLLRQWLTWNRSSYLWVWNALPRQQLKYNQNNHMKHNTRIFFVLSFSP